MRLTLRAERGVQAICRAVAEFGTVVGVDGPVVAIELVGIGYRFRIDERGVFPDVRPLVVLASVTGIADGDVHPLTVAGEMLVVPLDVAAAVVGRFRRYACCEPCRSERHDACLWESEQLPCRCDCSDERAAVRVARAQAAAIPGGARVFGPAWTAPTQPVPVVRPPLPPAPAPVVSPVPPDGDAGRDAH